MSRELDVYMYDVAARQDVGSGEINITISRQDEPAPLVMPEENIFVQRTMQGDVDFVAQNILRPDLTRVISDMLDERN